MSDYTATFTVAAAPEQVFDAVNDVRSWWDGEISGPTAALGDVFTYTHEPQHRSTQRVTESVPGRRVVWHVDDAELTFVADRTEWVGTDIEIEPADDGTRLTFTLVGLEPAVECYEACSTAWGWYITRSLRDRIADVR